MIEQLNVWIGLLNQWSDAFWRFSTMMFVQVSVLVLVLLCLEVVLRKRARAVTRYCLWVLVLAKLMLPVQLGTPVSAGYWLATPVAFTAENAERSALIEIGHAEPAKRATAEIPSRLQNTTPSETMTTSHAIVHLPPAEASKAVPTARTSPQVASLQWKAIVFAAWMGIAASLLGFVARKAIIVRRIVRVSEDATDEFRSVVNDCQSLLGMKSRKVSVQFTDRFSSPAICGFWKPVILLPRGLHNRLDREQLRLVFVHELAHWKRFDLQINSLQTFLQVIYFYNPAVWFANSMIRRLREEAVDETVLVATRVGAERYGSTLLDVATAELLPAELTLSLIGVVESRRRLAGRIKRIIGLPVPKTAKLGIATLGLILIAGLMLLPMAGKTSTAAPQDEAPAQRTADKPATEKPVTEKPVTNEPAAPESALRGRLVDETGAPVTDAEIELTYRANYRSQKTKSDSEGNYKFEHVDSAGVYQIEIHSKRWVGIVDRKALPRVDLKPQLQVVRDFTLARACQLQVKVVDEQGNPIDGVDVLSSLVGDNQNFASRAATNKKGRAILAGLAPSSEERLVATMGGADRPFTRALVKLNNPGTPVKLQIVVPLGKTVAGKALCTDGKPATGWRINAIPTWWRFGITPMGQVIAEDGSFSLPQITPDSYNVVVSIPIGQQMSMSKPVLSDTRLPAGSEPLAVTVDYASPGSMAALSGRIEYSGGKLQRGMHLFARSSDNLHRGDTYIKPQQQEFEIGPVPRGTYRLEFDSTEIEPLTLSDVKIPSDKKLTVEVKVRGAISLIGIVTRADDGKPVTKYRAQILKTRTLKGPNYVQNPDWRDVSDSKGAFQFNVAGPGIYVVQVMAEGLGLTASKPFNTETDGGAPIRIEMATGKPIAGTVVDEQGKPISGAKVFPLPNAAIRNGQLVGQLTPGEPVVVTQNGKFTMPQLPATRGVIKVVHPDFAPAVLDTNETDSNSNLATATVVLPLGATVRGHVYDADGKPQPNAELRFQDRVGYSGFDDEKYGLLARVVSNADGYYEAHHLPAQFCYVQRDDPWKTWGTVRHAIQTANGKTQTLDFGGNSKLTGRLIVNGSPIANARVQLSGENPNFGIYKAFAKSDQNGTFTFWGTPPGERTLYFTTSPQSDSWVRIRDVEAPVGDAELGDIQCSFARLTVRVEAAVGTTTDGAQMQLQEFNPRWFFRNSVGRPLAHSNPEDPYVFEQVPPGKYELVYYRPSQFAVRQSVEIALTSGEESVTLKVPPASASLSGKLAPTICGPDGCRALNIWSTDQHLAGTITPNSDGTYRLENIPAGDYTIRDKDTRDADALLKVSLREGELKTLDIIPDTVSVTTKPVGFAILEVLTTDGVPLPGSKLQFDDAANAPVLSSAQEGRKNFVGTPGIHVVTIDYPGFNPLRLNLDLKPVDKDGRAIGDFRKRVELQQMER
jgi:beta-lactamase regulating signal transducer with metallopeptidase domain/uncharacterized GH25 family protein